MPRAQKPPLLSAGLLMCRRGPTGEPEVLLAHPGGPFFARKDLGAWTVPKGLVEAGEEPLAAAQREFQEETGFVLTTDSFHWLGEVEQRRNKRVCAWAFAGDCDPAQLRSNTFEMVWPPRSGQRKSFPEIDRVAFFSEARAGEKILAGQRPLVVRAFSAELQPALFGSADSER